MRRKNKKPPTHLPLIPPGEILNEEFLDPINISQNVLARAIDVPPARINDLVHARRSITPDTAARLAQRHLVPDLARKIQRGRLNSHMSKGSA